MPLAPSLSHSQQRPLLLASSTAMHLLALALPLALLQIYDRILPSQSFGTALFLVLGVGIAIILEATLRYGRQVLFASLGAAYEAHATQQALQRLYAADVEVVEARGTASIVDAFRAIAQVRDFWSGQAGAALYELPFVLLYIALIGYVGGWLALIPLALFGLAIVLALALNPAIARLSEQVNEQEDQRNRQSWSLFSALSYLKGNGAENLLASLWQRDNARYMATSAELETRLGWVRENATTFGQLATVLIVAFGAIGVMHGELTTGALAACTMLAGRSIGPAMASLGYWAQLQRIRAAQRKVDDLLNLPSGRETAPSPATRNKVEQGELQVKAPGLLTEPLRVRPGEIVHLATRDPAMTSRLMSAIAGMTQIAEIQVEVDGLPVSAYEAGDYRAGVTLVTRHLALIPGSILNNLTLYDPRYNADVEPLCAQLGLDRYVARLRSGILTEVGAGTAEHLDEGVYQRIAIIRALLRSPRILLLDHAASGIDLDGQKRLAALLSSLQGKVTVLVATYKEPLIAACSRSIQVDSLPVDARETSV
ncbi:ATP-binding cassette domain-containing protein [Aeromonas veronii]|nr:ATP-binding cassette domain-containing protein [Aeromonas veronii]